jgi:hypothetical protein
MMEVMVRGRSARQHAPQHGEAPAAFCHSCGLHGGPAGVHREALPPHHKSSRPKRRWNIVKGATRRYRAAMGNNSHSRLPVCRGLGAPQLTAEGDWPLARPAGRNEAAKAKNDGRRSAG